MNKINDNFIVGIFLGLICPVIVCFFLNILIKNILRESTIHVICLMINFPLLRIFLINYEKDKLGRGILFISFILTAIFIFKHDMIQLF